MSEEKKAFFKDFNLHEQLMEGVEAMGFEHPTPIQEMTIPLTLQGSDVIGVAQTGTGKTAAFLLPIMSKILQSKRDHINALIVVPTRELAMQIDQAIQGFGYFAGITSMAIYGGGDGSDFAQEKTALTSGVDIVVATPGRIISHMNLKYADFSRIETLVLDEADRMLDMGFYADITRIEKLCNQDRQTLLFSATMPSRILELTKKLQKNPKQVNIGISKPAEGVMQVAYVVNEEQKPGLIATLLVDKGVNSGIVFSSTKRNVAVVNRMLQRKGVNCKAISSDLDQTEREKVLLGFRNKKVKILVATDVVARGIDVEDIELVINYDVPGDAEDYVHRVGRTARAKKTGVAITFINKDDQGKFKKIEELIEQEIRKLPVPEHLGPAPEYRPGSFSGKRRFSGKRKFDGKRKGPNPRKK